MSETEGFYQPTEADKAKYADMRVVILAPCGDYKSPIRWVHSLTNMMAYSWMHGLKITCLGYTERTVVDWARNILGRSFRDGVDPYSGEKYTHALWLDDDHIFNPDMAVRLAALGELDMVSAVYYQRTKPHHPAAYVKDDTDNRHKHWPLMVIPPAVVEIDACGFGALLMRREVLEGTPEPWFTLDWQAGEDIAFCVRAKEHGFRVWLAGDYQIGHLGRVPVITAADSLRHQEEHPEEYGEKVRISMETPIYRGAQA